MSQTAAVPPWEGLVPDEVSSETVRPKSTLCRAVLCQTCLQIQKNQEEALWADEEDLYGKVLFQMSEMRGGSPDGFSRHEHVHLGAGLVLPN